jgi:glycosyltransferase involved in cell wall biosynthesis
VGVVADGPSRWAIPVVLHVLMFFPRGGSAQVVRALARELDAAGTWRARVLSGSLGEPGAPGNARTFFEGLEVLPVPYDDAVASPDPLLASPPMHPSFEDRPDAPDRVFASLDDATYEHIVAEWARILAAPGVLDGVAVAHMHHLTPAHEALRRVRPDLPVVTHLHGTELLMLDEIAAGAPWPHAGAWAARMRRWAQASARVIASSEASRRSAAHRLGLAAERVDVVPNGIDPRAFDGRRAGGAERRAFWRRNLVEAPRGWSPADPRPGSVGYTPTALAPLEDPAATIVLYIGRFTAVKRTPLLVRAHARARGRLGAPLPLVLWGGFPGEWEGEHPAEVAAASPFGEEVFLAGWHEHGELPAALAAADVMAGPSAQERFGLPYIEAMAMGVPPIACATGAPPGFIDADPASPERSGWLVPPDDEGALAEVLLAAAAAPAERARRGAAGRRHVLARFSWPALARQVEAIYAALAAAADRA